MRCSRCRFHKSVIIGVKNVHPGLQDWFLDLSYTAKSVRNTRLHFNCMLVSPSKRGCWTSLSQRFPAVERMKPEKRHPPEERVVRRPPQVASCYNYIVKKPGSIVRSWTWLEDGTVKFSPFGDQFLTRVKAAAGRTAEDMNADDAGFALFHSVRRQRKQEAGLLVADHFISVQTRRLCVCVCVQLLMSPYIHTVYRFPSCSLPLSLPVA